MRGGEPSPRTCRTSTSQLPLDSELTLLGLGPATHTIGRQCWPEGRGPDGGGAWSRARNWSRQAGETRVSTRKRRGWGQSPASRGSAPVLRGPAVP